MPPPVERVKMRPAGFDKDRQFRHSVPGMHALPHADRDDDPIRILPRDWLHPIDLDAWFGCRRPLAIDLGSGKGRFLLARAAHHADVSFLGVDRMLRRVRKVARRARRLALENVRLLRMEAYYATMYLIPPDRVQTYYIFFPDPWPKKRHHDHRLFNQPFLDAVHRTLEPGGTVHVATDHQPYYQEIRDLLAADHRFQETDPFVPGPDEQTDFERYYVQHTRIGRVSVRKP